MIGDTHNCALNEPVMCAETVTVNNKYRIQLPPEPKYQIIAIVKGKLPECFRGYWLMRLMPDGTDEKTTDIETVKDGDKFWAIPPCGY